MRMIAATLLAFIAPIGGALAEQPVSRVTPVSGQQVYAICAEITQKESGHPVRDCMSAIDTFLTQHNVPRE